MESIKEQAKKTRDFFKDKFTHNYRSVKLRYQGTKMYKNIDSMVKFQNIYYELVNK